MGCLTSLAAPVIGFVIYPKVKWLFVFPLLGVVLVVLEVITRKDPIPADAADRADRILSGIYGKYEVDDCEHLNPKNPKLKELWEATLSVHRLPEEWVALDEVKKSELRELIRKVRELPSSN
ncbi:MAG TPA: hypothetical protein VFM77_11350 [Terriglobales bacterium]|nr:hypothetical protein [Terriglobales bacterium]